MLPVGACTIVKVNCVARCDCPVDVFECGSDTSDTNALKSVMFTGIYTEAPCVQLTLTADPGELVSLWYENVSTTGFDWGARNAAGVVTAGFEISWTALQELD